STTNGTPLPCNENGIYDSLVLNITVTSDKSDYNGFAVATSTAATFDSQMTGVTQGTVSGSTYTLSVRWDTLITSLFAFSDCTSGCGGTKTFYFGPLNSDSAYAEKIAVTVNLNYINSTNAANRALANACPPSEGTLTSPNSSYGFCYYKMVPGDNKAYITDNIPGWWTSTSAAKDPVTSIPYSQVVMYYAEKDFNSTDYVGTIKSIKNNSAHANLNITDNSEDPLEDYKISDLENGKSYCFLPAIKDMTGNIEYFTDITVINSTSGDISDKSILCADPSEVIGVLGDKSCFIATAAFGSVLHPYLNILRQFRDQILLNLSLGRKFVKWYYQYGPIGAKWIDSHPMVKPVVRGLLIPVIGSAFLFLNYPSIFWSIVLLVFLSLGWLFKKKIKLHWIKNHRIIFYILILSFGFFHQVKAQGAPEDEFMEEPLSPPVESDYKDTPPNEPPYTTPQDQVDADNMSDEFSEDVAKKPSAPINDPKIENHPAPTVTPVPNNPIVKDDDSASPVTDKDHYMVKHPNAAKGLYLIDQNTGKYYYKIKKKSHKNQATSIRVGSMDPPNIIAGSDGNQFSFIDMYGDASLPYLLLDYEWQPFTSFGKLGVVMGLGFFTATAKGMYADTVVAQKYGRAPESYTFIGLPLSAGGIYRLEFGRRQWVVPFVNGGLSYYALAEIRDDGKKTTVVGTPAAYGGGGVMLNITAWDRDIAFTMDNEYDIANMWLTAEYRYVQSLNEDLDVSASIINVGISVDY
ncbi:MAG: hypothetical protein KDD45_10795, partial [Bdellovibrionales bacterium]|nr:hypothetical protein [Bdellovibrionales bacterium]